jgi:hypothetical protein
MLNDQLNEFFRLMMMTLNFQEYLIDLFDNKNSIVYQEFDQVEQVYF